MRRARGRHTALRCAGALSSFAKARRSCLPGALGAADAGPLPLGLPAWLADLGAPFSCRTLAVLLDSRRRRVLTQTLQARHTLKTNPPPQLAQAAQRCSHADCLLSR